MKPIRQPLFLTTLIAINIVFALALGTWIWLMVHDFRTINAETVPPSLPNNPVLNQPLPALLEEPTPAPNTIPPIP